MLFSLHLQSQNQCNNATEPSNDKILSCTGRRSTRCRRGAGGRARSRSLRSRSTSLRGAGRCRCGRLSCTGGRTACSGGGSASSQYLVEAGCDGNRCQTVSQPHEDPHPFARVSDLGALDCEGAISVFVGDGTVDILRASEVVSLALRVSAKLGPAEGHLVPTQYSQCIDLGDVLSKCRWTVDECHA